MCLRPVKIKAVNSSSPLVQFVPCGVCEECRRREKSGWSLRLGLELQKCIDDGWSVCFCTLTYNDEHLPKIPLDCFLDPREYEEIPCFNSDECRKFIRNLRSILEKKYAVVGCKYMLTCEYGERRGRPHMHFLISFPSSSSEDNGYISVEDMHAEICRLWCSKGYVFPEKPEGGRVYEDGDEKPFKVDTTKGAYLCAKYVTKYVCKDVGFKRLQERKAFVNKKNQGGKIPKFNLFGKLVVDKDGNIEYETAYQRFRRCRPFHLQSRSLGWSLIAEKSDEYKMNVYRDGLFFLGNDYAQKLPVYIKNKLVYDNYYVIDEKTQKRLCRRTASKFFCENVEKIFELKVRGYQQLFESFLTVDYWTTRGVSQRDYVICKQYFQGFLTSYGLRLDDFARCFLVYFGVPYDSCRLCCKDDAYMMYFKRYYDVFPNKKIPSRVLDLSDVPLVDRMFKESLDNLVYYLFSLAAFCEEPEGRKTKLLKQYKLNKEVQRCSENVKI